ncbi:hypothetical protein LGIHADK_01489 [Mannheimia haemolytica]
MLPTDLETKLHINNLNFYYGDFHALKNINMRIAKNKVTAFIGPSGCGKSTLLRTLNRMFELYPNQRATGEINLDGENLLTSDTDISIIRAKVGMVFKNRPHSRCPFTIMLLLVFVCLKNCRNPS